MDQVSSLQYLAKHMPDNLVGLTVYVYWATDRRWYKAQINKYFEGSKKYKVVYDDNKSERLDMTRQQFLTEDDKNKRKLIKANSDSSLKKRKLKMELKSQ